MKYLKTFENYTQINIDKKYYVWKLPHFPEYKIGVIKILEASTKNIKYTSLKRTDWRIFDFFTNKQKKNITDDDTVSLRKWKKDKHNILFETDNEEDSIIFYNLYISNKNINKDNWETYRDTNKYNL
jgi:hypothetical protein